jgi:hypothetical protein
MERNTTKWVISFHLSVNIYLFYKKGDAREIWTFVPSFAWSSDVKTRRCLTTIGLNQQCGDTIQYKCPYFTSVPFFCGLDRVKLR